MFKQLQLKKHALTAISYMLPVVVTAGLLIAIGNLSDRWRCHRKLQGGLFRSRCTGLTGCAGHGAIGTSDRSSDCLFNC